MALREFLRLVIASTHRAPRRGEAARKVAVACAGLTPDACEALEIAQQQAQQFCHRYVGPEHILLGLLALGEGMAASALRQFGLRSMAAHQALSSRSLRDERAAPTEWLSNRAIRVVERAKREANDMGCPAANSAHLLLSLLGEEGLAADILREGGVAPDRLREVVLGILTCG